MSHGCQKVSVAGNEITLLPATGEENALFAQTPPLSEQMSQAKPSDDVMSPLPGLSIGFGLRSAMPRLP